MNESKAGPRVPWSLTAQAASNVVLITPTSATISTDLTRTAARRVIRDAVTTLAAMPNCQNVKALTNHASGYRLRVGSYRVLFDWDGEIKIVEINEVSKRDEGTY